MASNEPPSTPQPQQPHDDAPVADDPPTPETPIRDQSSVVNSPPTPLPDTSVDNDEQIDDISEHIDGGQDADDLGEVPANGTRSMTTIASTSTTNRRRSPRNRVATNRHVLPNVNNSLPTAFPTGIPPNEFVSLFTSAFTAAMGMMYGSQPPQPETPSNLVESPTYRRVQGNRRTTSSEYLNERCGEELSFPKFDAPDHALFVELFKLLNWSVDTTNWENVASVVWPAYREALFQRDNSLKISYKSAKHLKEHARVVETALNRPGRKEKQPYLRNLYLYDFLPSITREIMAGTSRFGRTRGVYKCGSCGLNKTTECQCEKCKVCKKMTTKCICVCEQCGKKKSEDCACDAGDNEENDMVIANDN